MFTKRDVYSKPVKLQHRHFVLLAELFAILAIPPNVAELQNILQTGWQEQIQTLTEAVL